MIKYNKRSFDNGSIQLLVNRIQDAKPLKENVNAQQIQRILETLQDGMTVHDVMAVSGVSRKKSSAALHYLIRYGFLQWERVQ